VAEVQITRICNFGFFALIARWPNRSPALHSRGDSASALNRFVEARLAESSNAFQTAASRSMPRVLKEQPDNTLAGKAHTNAIEVGDFTLALKSRSHQQLRGQAIRKCRCCSMQKHLRSGTGTGLISPLSNWALEKIFPMQPFLGHGSQPQKDEALPPPFARTTDQHDRQILS
jgi:hypothetical protein